MLFFYGSADTLKKQAVTTDPQFNILTKPAEAVLKAVLNNLSASTVRGLFKSNQNEKNQTGAGRFKAHTVPCSHDYFLSLTLVHSLTKHHYLRSLSRKSPVFFRGKAIFFPAFCTLCLTSSSCPGIDEVKLSLQSWTTVGKFSWYRQNTSLTQHSSRSALS